jgi:hypothetical protein
MHQPSRSLAYLALAVCPLLTAGCDAERPESRAPDLVGVDLGDQGAARSKPKAAAPAKPKANTPKKPEFIVGRRTQDIKDANVELKTGGARVGSTKITAKDPITLQGNAYVTMIGQTSILQIQHAVDLYHAENDRYPKDLNEFMEEIIKKNNIALPTLPYYQEYGYDANQHKLIILEYEDRKNQPPG